MRVPPFLLAVAAPIPIRRIVEDFLPVIVNPTLPLA
jgi:hypothetical protein